MVADAKWKLIDNALDDGEEKYGLSQADFYQLYAYGQKYLHGTGTLYLFYPKTSSFRTPLPPFHFSDQLRLFALPFDLQQGSPVSEFLARWLPEPATGSSVSGSSSVRANRI